MNYRLPAPALTWKKDGAPKSTQFDDIYFDSQSGINETDYVFIQKNNLIERWSSLAKPVFTIAETGFGTGLNFLCAWRAWKESAASNKTLHFISVEKYPLSKEILSNALKMWPELSKLSDELIANYPVVCHGLHRISLDNGNLQLTLWFGEASEGFTALNANVDAWFLDGFAPSKNPEMWSNSLFNEILRLSDVGTTFSTFTAAGIVRRGLQSTGFNVQKVKGFGIKREMLVGILEEQPLTFNQRMSEGLPWLSVRSETSTPKKVLIVGAGLAGSHCASQLASRGISVEVWDRGNEIASGASGNPQGMIYPKLASHDTPLNRFYLAGYMYTHRLLSRIDPSKKIWNDCGLIQKPITELEVKRFEKILSDKIYPEEVLRQNQEFNELFLPLSGWVKPKELCSQLLNHPNIKVTLNKPLVKIDQQSTYSWVATSNESSDTFSHIIFCQAHTSSIADTYLDLPRMAIRGQVSSFVLNKDLSIDNVLCHEGYVSPPISHEKQRHLHFGSTYSLNDSDETVRFSDHIKNLEKLTQLLPNHNWQKRAKDCIGRVSFRCTISDYTPIVGPIFDKKVLQETYAQLGKNAKWKSNLTSNPLPGLFINIGHGSKGLISTPLSACYLTSLILNEPTPLERAIERVIHPSRFIIRQLKRAS
ncbi:bifunctional tRNA (5-methylaminomethyl-2-thiouridine)(34)-methyltransferase MnmD/FAD-dependent 5-carboxymethylaminomethyl-2-thiouridine(34) oxidoreductase MnmC [Marinomonas sp. 15G1-11]|uniref:tRNA 5-methylaminomethyl-2-thiouridine biosynthesis bifunctional protein MnmC n=1 Tax=Marinomonas phaeophyticola TaxID=3004091 RepID=A0ABT4JY81_9GAMM|nr:bifunctional tRNA (5-methylaminomethyl-2-thiouridine)(34)-methyltransferase MnmD/FAD-dependent 5-carboxymethylaminomethyl-2-thiouridine(34) oxidoreductase MnmC [Marinomonas sp. 15G1-11]MCZ2723335.1 bifunctional tRNA (5-methylaminomethyl-2-thiouridine)(34)-methyltransferase MnmD/FAD-dependent 5-carboxymethylaminomethyl-2-thiouridine(34) oxidoreductase MnmC [Marinomonas sp. 15G1-11]